MRIIGIQHRVKLSADGEARPTRVAVIHPLVENELFATKELATEQDEANFVQDLQPEDLVAMVLGGSGDYLAYAAYRKAQQVGARVMRIPAYALKDARKSGAYDSVRNGLYRTLRKKGAATDPKAEDHVLLALLAREEPEQFYPLADTDASLILARESWRALLEAMKARMAGEQRLRQLFIGRVFTRPDGLFPEGGIEKGFDAAKASDPILAALRKEEAKRERELVMALDALPVYRTLFEPIPGVGPKIAGRIISAIVDIRRFDTGAKLKAYMGVHVLADGKFPRRRHGSVANWSGDARQALFLLGDQFNRRPDTHWGQYLRRMKAELRKRHPEPVVGENGKKKYTDAHIHKMATWRTLTRFVEWLYAEWTRLDRAPLEELARAA